ncbi:unnamed protein product [Pieris macdunnoughi]|uniref:Uncharacterized protein n=1 Tax=Pieris macdunnoughi TaxID=345717 RepID=A0A821XVM8_9NEOP|nr:unnamed protein product [Pieris macdunnoughi]
MNNSNRGQPRGRSQNSGGNRRPLRDAQRAYNHNADQQRFVNWAYEPEPFDYDRVKNKAPTKRSQTYKSNKQPRAQTEEQTVTPSTSATPMRDEPLYDMGPHSSLLATQDVYCQNFEYSGFIPIVNQTYEKLRGVDPRLHERLPLSMFTHTMSAHLNLEILETARQSGQNVLNLRTGAREALPDYQVIPQPIVDYISHIASVMTQDGKEVRLNLPQIAIPQGPIEVDGVRHPSGSFGVLVAQNHNVYECYISPLESSNRVIAWMQRNADYLPLPDGLIPGNLIPNRNLLGFEPVDVPAPETRYQGIQFPNDDSIEGRYRISETVQNPVYVVLAEMKDRFKMKEYRRVQNEKGLNLMEKVQYKITAVNLTFVETTGPINDALIPLYTRNVAIHSFGAQGSATSNQANIECFHRRRINRGAHIARGFCCTTPAGQGPGGWNASLNHNFAMEGLFGPVVHADYNQLRESMFTSHASAGVRTNALDNFIERNYYVDNK